jgi:hypothetical protein
MGIEWENDSNTKFLNPLVDWFILLGLMLQNLLALVIAYSRISYQPTSISS